MTLGLYPELRDRQRLLGLARTGVDRQTARPYLTGIVEAVAEQLETRYAVISVLLDDAQAFIAGCGPLPDWIAETGGTPIEWAFCLPMLRSRAGWFVNDFTADPVHAGNPLVTVEGIRSYVAAPLITRDGQVLGGLCALDVRPRDFGADQVAYLQDLADEAVRRIEAAAEPDIMAT